MNAVLLDHTTTFFVKKVMSDVQRAQETEEDAKLFPMTRWTLVAKTRDREAATKALSELCEMYWYPVYAYIRSMGKPHHDAQDLAQSFFAALLEKDGFSKGDPELGRLRCYLCVAVKRHVFTADRDGRRQKRGGGKEVYSLDADEADRKFSREPCNDESPETFFDKRWATKVIETAIAKIRKGYEARGKVEQFEAARPFLSLYSGEGEHEAIAQSLGLKTNAFRTIIYRLRQRYKEALREIVGDTLTDKSKIDEELQHLFEIFER